MWHRPTWHRPMWHRPGVVRHSRHGSRRGRGHGGEPHGRGGRGHRGGCALQQHEEGCGRGARGARQKRYGHGRRRLPVGERHNRRHPAVVGSGGRRAIGGHDVDGGRPGGRRPRDSDQDAGTSRNHRIGRDPERSAGGGRGERRGADRRKEAGPCRRLEGCGHGMRADRGHRQVGACDSGRDGDGDGRSSIECEGHRSGVGRTEEHTRHGRRDGRLTSSGDLRGRADRDRGRGRAFRGTVEADVGGAEPPGDAGLGRRIHRHEPHAMVLARLERGRLPAIGDADGEGVRTRACGNSRGR